MTPLPTTLTRPPATSRPARCCMRSHAANAWQSWPGSTALPAGLTFRWRTSAPTPADLTACRDGAGPAAPPVVVETGPALLSSRTRTVLPSSGREPNGTPRRLGHPAPCASPYRGDPHEGRSCSVPVPARTRSPWRGSPPLRRLCREVHVPAAKTPAGLPLPTAGTRWTAVTGAMPRRRSPSC